MTGPPAWLPRIGATLAAALGMAVVSAIGLTILDLYLTGHNYPSLDRTWFVWPVTHARLTYANAVWWGSIIAAGIVTWWRYGRGG